MFRILIPLAAHSLSRQAKAWLPPFQTDKGGMEVGKKKKECSWEI
jgi:hypothetical protein